MTTNDPILTTEYFEAGKVTVRNQILGLTPFLGIEILENELKLTLAGVAPEDSAGFVEAMREVLGSVNIEFTYVDEDPGTPVTDSKPISG